MLNSYTYFHAHLPHILQVFLSLMTCNYLLLRQKHALSWYNARTHRLTTRPKRLLFVANIITRKSVMTLFSSPTCAMSHCARFVLYEKGIAADIEYYDPNNAPEDLLELNSTGVSPTLVERDLVLYDSRIIMEYLDERFPHPPLHQMDPVSRANARMIIKRIDQEWYQLLDEVQLSGEKKSARAKKMLKESILEANLFCR